MCWVELAFVKDKTEAKNREKEDRETREKPKLFIKAYKKRIDLEKVREKYDEEYSVANKGFGMMVLYSSLLTKNKLFYNNKIENKINNNTNKKVDSSVRLREDIEIWQEVKANQIQSNHQMIIRLSKETN